MTLLGLLLHALFVAEISFLDRASFAIITDSQVLDRAVQHLLRQGVAEGTVTHMSRSTSHGGIIHFIASPITTVMMMMLGVAGVDLVV